MPRTSPRATTVTYNVSPRVTSTRGGRPVAGVRRDVSDAGVESGDDDLLAEAVADGDGGGEVSDDAAPVPR